MTFDFNYNRKIIIHLFFIHIGIKTIELVDKMFLFSRTWPKPRLRTGGSRTIKVLQGYIYSTVLGFFYIPNFGGKLSKIISFNFFENRFEKKDSFKGTVECRDRPATLHWNYAQVPLISLILNSQNSNLEEWLILNLEFTINNKPWVNTTRISSYDKH